MPLWHGKSRLKPAFEDAQVVTRSLAHRLSLVTWFLAIATTYTRSVLSSFHVFIHLSVLRAHMHISLNLTFPVASLCRRRVCVCVKPLESQGTFWSLRRGWQQEQEPATNEGTLAFLDTGADHPSVPASHLSLP